jgi:flagellar biosynthesis protein FlhG
VTSAPRANGLDDQAAALRRLMASLEATAARIDPAVRTVEVAAPEPDAPREAHAIAIASGKGGVGKTNICVNLAVAMAARGARVVLLDADLGLANADVLCGVRVHGHLGHVLAGSRTIDEITVETPGGFRLIPGAAGIASLADASEHSVDALMERVGGIDQGADVLLIDCGAGIGRTVLSFLAAADRCLVVTTPEPTAITDAYALIKVAVGSGAATNQRLPMIDAARLGIVVNMADDAREAMAAQERIAGVCERFLGIRPLLAGWAPRDEAVHRAVRARAPFMLERSKSPVAQRIDLLARDLLAGIPIEARPSGNPRGGFVRRLLSLPSRNRGAEKANSARPA